MKWIGQHIWDFISRFRSDVYLEGTETGTIASGGNLGLDSNNKIVKSASPSGTIDLTDEVTGVLPVANGGSGTNTLLDNAILTGTGTTPITAEANLTYNGSTEVLELSSSTTSRPVFKLQNTNADAEGPVMQFIKNSSSPAVDDELGHIQFLGDDSGGASSVLAEIIGYTQDKDDGSEEGKLTLKVASHDVEMQPGLSIFSGNAEDEVDVTIGNGATSLTTIAGTLTMGSTAFVNNSGVIQVATQGTIDHDSLANFVANEHLDWTGNTGTPIHRGNITTLDQINGGVHFSSNSAENPVIRIENNHTTAGQSGELRFIKDAANVDDGEYLGRITFYGDNDAGTPEEIKYCEIIGQAKDVSDGAEEGFMYLNIASHDGEMKSGVQIFSGDAEDEVDVTIGNGATSLTTTDGHLVVTSNAYIANRDYSYPGTSDGDHTAGDIMYYDSGTVTTVAGKIYYFNGSGSWTIANADATADSTGMLAVALGNNPDVDGMLLRGFVTLYDIDGTEDHGAKLYLHTADGEASATAPGSGNVVRVIGYNLHNTNDSVYFNPDNSWVEVS